MNQLMISQFDYLIKRLHVVDTKHIYMRPNMLITQRIEITRCPVHNQNVIYNHIDTSINQKKAG